MNKGNDDIEEYNDADFMVDEEYESIPDDQKQLFRRVITVSDNVRTLEDRVVHLEDIVNAHKQEFSKLKNDFNELAYEYNGYENKKLGGSRKTKIKKHTNKKRKMRKHTTNKKRKM